ncbi:MAG: DNA repair protein RecO, partial [Flavobacteriaceae bacterium]|nr:DNA repair protein RecO [Flavobacteriaceae bacterium]
QYIREARIDKKTSTIHSDFIKGCFVLFLAEVLSMILKEDDTHSDLYRFIETTIIWFDSNDIVSSFHLKFLVEITKYLGFYPDLDPRADYFDLLEGQSQDFDTGLYSISGENLSLLKQVLGIKFDVTNTIQMSVSQKRSFLDMILLYFRLHLDGFKEPKSLTVLNEVFTDP